MEECYICFSNLKSSDFKLLSCSHRLCESCYLKLEQAKCPLCRKEFLYNTEDIKKRRELGIENKYNSPSAQLNYSERTRINDFSNLNSVRSVRRNNRNNNIEDVGIGIVGRQRYRKRRKNLSEEEILEKRKIIREKCKRKKMIKENRLNKVNWFEINVN